jgi:hypothetical protein
MHDTEMLHAIEAVEERLNEEFGSTVPAEEITRQTRESLQRYHRARIKTFVPVLVHRDARDALRAELSQTVPFPRERQPEGGR